MKRLNLTKSKFALVDDEDYILLNQYRWYAQKGLNTYYATRHEGPNRNNMKTIYMHRQLLNLIFNDKRESDHINHNGLDNRRSNLRIVTSGQNKINKRIFSTGVSKYRGVTWRSKRNKWEAKIQKDKCQYHLGHFEKELDAAKRYDIEAKKIHGEYAILNFKETI